jgi:hypothetical protein
VAFLRGDLAAAHAQLEAAAVLAAAEEMGGGGGGVVAEVQYRLGRVQWSLGGPAREERGGALAHLLAAAAVPGRCQAAAFTWVGHFYHQVAADAARAQKCYQVCEPRGRPHEPRAPANDDGIEFSSLQKRSSNHIKVLISAPGVGVG